MTTFVSPRFQGDDLLEQILNDPDTGTVKLGPGSSEQSVITLQHALFDLSWNIRINPTVEHEIDFVDGIYGERTTEAVTRYKRRYDIHFPPSAPTGFIDGFAGPRTLRKLDEHCVLLDEAIAAIRAKIDELNLSGVPTEAEIDEHATQTLLDTSGTFTPCVILGRGGGVHFKRGVGAHAVHGNIFDAYENAGGAQGSWGFPVSDERDAEDPFLRVQDFEHGFMTRNRDSGEVRQIGPDPSAPEPGLF
jgi:hypothetical protein